MAPKKSIPLKNLLSHRGSSSSSSSSSLRSRDRFFDSKSQKDFEENFCDRAIHWERLIVLCDFPNTLLPGTFSSRCWESLCEKPSRCSSVFI